MLKIEKRCWPEYFQAILDGKKAYEVRLNDFEIGEGDVLILREWNPETKEYNGRTIEKKVTYVGKFMLDKLFWPKEEIEKHGLQVISLK